MTTELTAAQINSLASIAHGDTLGRVASKDAALKRFARVLADRIGDDLAARDLAHILDAPGLETAQGRLAAAMDEADARAVQSTQADAGAPAQGDPAPAGNAHGATFATGPVETVRKPRGAAPEAPTDDPAALATAMETGAIQHTERRLRAVAEAGIIPPAPDFSAETHKRFRGKLAEVVALVEKRDADALEAVEINPVSSSPKAIARYRDAAVIAIRKQHEAARPAA